jgi:hypothetical protein
MPELPFQATNVGLGLFFPRVTFYLTQSPSTVTVDITVIRGTIGRTVDVELHYLRDAGRVVLESRRITVSPGQPSTSRVISFTVEPNPPEWDIPGDYEVVILTPTRLPTGVDVEGTVSFEGEERPVTPIGRLIEDLGIVRRSRAIFNTLLGISGIGAAIYISNTMLRGPRR